MSKTTPKLKLPKTIESSVVFDESLVKIQRDQLQIDPYPVYFYYSLITKPFSVVILATTPKGEYVLTKEYRHPTSKILLGCPGGYMEEGEDALQAAQREFLEETGYQAASFQIIGSAFPYAGFSGQKTVYVKATQAIPISKPKLEASEVLCSCLYSLKSIQEAIFNGIPVDGTLCTALFFSSISS